MQVKCASLSKISGPDLVRPIRPRAWPANLLKTDVVWVDYSTGLNVKIFGTSNNWKGSRAELRWVALEVFTLHDQIQLNATSWVQLSVVRSCSANRLKSWLELWYYYAQFSGLSFLMELRSHLTHFCCKLSSAPFSQPESGFPVCQTHLRDSACEEWHRLPCLIVNHNRYLPNNPPLQQINTRRHAGSTL